MIVGEGAGAGALTANSATKASNVASHSEKVLELCGGKKRHCQAICCPRHRSLIIAIMKKHTVKLHGRHCQISVYREGKHIWFAVGDYLGKEIRVEAESEGAAVKRWRETASTMGATERAGPE